MHPSAVAGQPQARTQNRYQQIAYSSDLLEDNSDGGITKNPNSLNHGKFSFQPAGDERALEGISLYQQAEELLRMQPAYDPTTSFSPHSSFQRRRRNANVGYRRLQEDPFGEKQVKPGQKPELKNGQFAPFADPTKKQTNPTVNPALPKGQPELQPPAGFQQPVQQPGVQQRVQQPLVNPNQGQMPKPGNPQRPVDPFADPPRPAPNQQVPADVEPPPGQETYPNQIQPGQIQGQPATQNPQDRNFDDGVDYLRTPSLQESPSSPVISNGYAPRPSNVYSPPALPQQQQPYPQEYFQNQPIQQDYVQPGYQPPYQPIPGLQSQQQQYYGQETYQPNQYASPNQLPSESMQGVVPMDGVFSSVVEPAGISAAAGAQLPPNFYLSLFGGAIKPRRLDGESGQNSIFTRRGEGFGVALGRRNGMNLRTEAEFSYRESDISGTAAGAPATTFTGSQTSYSGMANMYWEFVNVRTRWLKPYVGVGVGFIGTDVEARDGAGASLIPVSMDNDSSLAYQWMAGLNYKASQNLDLFAEYRFLQADSYRIDSSAAGVSGRYSYESDNVFVGMRWKF
ncbi:MAG: opacity protein-like surface antigen [Mariniblastus sp.]